MKRDFNDILKGKIVVVGIGNIIKGDDGFGPRLIERLKNKVGATCIDTGSSPENYTRKIAKENPDTILLVDAAHINLPPGEYEILSPQDILKGGFSTHDISLTMFIDYLKTMTKANIFLLGVEPKNISIGDDMSDSVKKTLDEVSKILENKLCMKHT